MQQTARLFGRDPIVITKRIQKEIYVKIGISASIGIAPNLFLSKVALDVESKHSNSRIAMWTYEDVSKKLWEILLENCFSPNKLKMLLLEQIEETCFRKAFAMIYN
ncbi:hypothetical protein QUF83_03015 [Bacillus cereus]|uniref:Y-family DNA polymerase n=1 Tax=Bacillus cereus TaxID=1396 RepID=UPI0025A15CAD|nr:hypothetical protein [Bacillus cereus]MDM5235203.1 hypothetical protein [Bacillus cereus]